MSVDDAPPRGRRGDRLAVGGLLLLVALVTLPVTLAGAGSETEISATLRAANALFAFLLGAVLFAFARRRCEVRQAFLTALPVVLSPQVVGSGTAMWTDNLSLALAAIAIGSAAFGTTEAGSRLVQGAAAGLAVATRSINVWLVAPIAASWWLGGRRRTGVTIAAMLLPVAVFGAFLLFRERLTTPPWERRGANPAAVGFALTLTAAYGLCLLPLLQRAARQLVLRPGLVIAAAVTGALLAAAGPSVASEAANPSGGWLGRAVADLPTIAGRSPLLLFGGSAGLLVVLMLFMEIEPHGQKHAALVILAAFAGAILAQVVNAEFVQRADDPMVLVTLVLLTVCLPPSRKVAFCLGLLAAQQLLFTSVALFGPMLR